MRRMVICLPLAAGLTLASAAATVKISKAKGAQNFSILLEKLDLSGVSILVKKG